MPVEVGGPPDCFGQELEAVQTFGQRDSIGLATPPRMVERSPFSEQDAVVTDPPAEPEKFFTNADFVVPWRPKHTQFFEKFFKGCLDKEDEEQDIPHFSDIKVFHWVYNNYVKVRGFAAMFMDRKTKFLSPAGREQYIEKRFKFSSVGAIEQTGRYVRAMKDAGTSPDEVEQVMRWVHYIFRYIVWWDVQPRFLAKVIPTKRKRALEWDPHRNEEVQRARYLPVHFTRSQWDNACWDHVYGQT